MTWKLVILCVCLQLSSIAIASKPILNNDNSNIGEDNEEREALIQVDDADADFHPRKMAESEHFEFLWLDMPILPIVWATSSTLPDGPCKEQAHLYLRHLKNHTLWATQMLDASTKYPDGILGGNTRHLGHFDLCYHLKTNVSHFGDADEPLENDEKAEIAGRYCIVDIKYEKQGLPPVDPLERLEVEFDPQRSVWEAVREKGDFRRVQRYLLQMALCVPEVCTAAEIESALHEPFALLGLERDMNFDVSVKPEFCQAKKEAPTLTLGGKIYCCILIGLVLLVTMSTWYDYSLKEYEKKDASKLDDLALCFSARRNLKSLMEITSDQPGLDTIHLIRFFYTMLVLLGHRTMQYYVGPTVNVSYAEWLFTSRLSTLAVSGQQVVEGFFGIGGLLVSYRILAELDKTKKLNYLRSIQKRFLRLTPAYALVVFFEIFVLPSMGSGPYWKWQVDQERESCANNWWANLMYINNYVNPESICMFQTWYVATDFQLFMLALIVIYAFWRMPRKWGYLFLVLVVFGGCIIPFANTYWYGVQPIIRGVLSLREKRDNRYFTDHYVKSHERITSYFIGVIAGAVLYDHNRNPWKLSKVCSHISFIFFVVVLSLGSELTGHKYFDPNENHGGLGAALHAALHRGAFALSCCAIPVLITVGQGLTFHYNFLTPRWVQPLGRLTYGVYLFHSVIQLHNVATIRTGREYNILNMFWDLIPDAVCVFSIALFISLTVEGPFRNIEKNFIMKRKDSKMLTGIKEQAKKAN